MLDHKIDKYIEFYILVKNKCLLINHKIKLENGRKQTDLRSSLVYCQISFC